MASAAASCFHTSSEMATPVRRYESALTSNSSNSKSAPAARSTLIASGTTSFPAPSHGTTAMRLGTSGGGFLLAQLVALQARLAVFLELGHQRVPRGHIALGDDEGFDLRESFDFEADHGALGH